MQKACGSCNLKGMCKEYCADNGTCFICDETGTLVQDCPMLCIDAIDEYGQMYGGCFKICNKADEEAAFRNVSARKPPAPPLKQTSFNLDQ